MISKTIGYNGVHYFQTHPNGMRNDHEVWNHLPNISKALLIRSLHLKLRPSRESSEPLLIARLQLRKIWERPMIQSGSTGRCLQKLLPRQGHGVTSWSRSRWHLHQWGLDMFRHGLDSQKVNVAADGYWLCGSPGSPRLERGSGSGSRQRSFERPSHQPRWPGTVLSLHKWDMWCGQHWSNTLKLAIECLRHCLWTLVVIRIPWPVDVDVHPPSSVLA